MGAQAIRVGVLGAGTVGAQVIRILTEDASLTQRIGCPVEVMGVLVRSIDSPRSAQIPAGLLTTDPEVFFPATPADSALPADSADPAGRACSRASGPRPDILVELIGGIEPARSLILRAFAQGTSVVSANKALIATHGAELFAAAAQHGVGFWYEAAVAGAVPIIRALRESLAGDHVTRIQGIVNGSTNFILDAMTTQGLEYDEVMTLASELGYLEADPSADIEGHDAAAKCAIMASLAFNADVTLADVATTGITHITAHDIAQAKDNGQVVKLIATAERTPEGIRVAVAPEHLPLCHPLASVGGANNAIYVTCENAGELMFYGPGAGGAPTASAVCGDVVQAARSLIHHPLLPTQPHA